MKPGANVLLLALGLGLAVVLVRQIGPAVVLHLLIRIGWRFLLIAAIYAVQVGVRAAALWRVMSESAVPYRDVLRIRLAAEAVETLTFTGPFLAEPAKGWLLVRRGTPASAAFAAVITEYLLYTVISSGVAIAALSVLLTRHALPNGLRPAAVLILVAAMAFIGAFMFAAFTGIGLIVPILRASHAVIGQRAARLADEFQRIEDGIIAFLHDRSRRLLEVLAIEAGAQALLVIEVWMLIAALGFSSSYGQSLVIEGGVKFVGIAFAFIPGQFGASEGAYALVARVVGLTAAVGVSVALARRLRSLLVAIVGITVLARLRDR